MKRFRSLPAAFATLLAISVTPVYAQQAPAAEENLPAPGTTGNAANVEFIGRADPNGNPVRLARKSGHVSNYDEAKVSEYRIPDVLVANDGQPVTTPEQWWTKRRPEILKFYRDNLYGNVPANAPKVEWKVTETDENARDGNAISQVLEAKMGSGENAPVYHMTLTLPKNAGKPVPVLLELSFGGGGNRGGRGGRAGAAPPAANAFNRNDELLKRGWGLGVITYGEIQPDRPGQWTQGVIGTTLAEGQTQPKPEEWGTIAAWAWGLSRAIDYLETVDAVNSKQIAITGASRLGKTVLWASANDDRIAATFSNVGGEMGAALIRRDWGETLDDMEQNFGYQFAGNLSKWVGKWNELPVDQHMLIALSAPRPVYINGGIRDQWSDPRGEFLSVKAAGPVYELLGGKGVGIDEYVIDQPVATGDLGYLYHSGGHGAVDADWITFLDFAERHFAAQK